MITQDGRKLQTMYLDIYDDSQKLQTITVRADIDSYTSSKLSKTITRLLKRGASFLVIDLGEVKHIDSSGLGVLCATAKILRQKGGALSLVITSPHLSRFFNITGFDRIMSLHGSVAAAQSACRHEAQRQAVA
ncbi:MAG: STAS domain-containing protein [Candidatus Eremiobacteraeota bacterium]|nr:STAS domain-containing protein [Candidatus Eremiobacteraeota bacterium]MBC5827475.1 STAS domain-containing protein [Candidatus Eremiobacteraeota bacterium]